MRFYLKKIGFYLVALFAALTLNFAIPRLMPGDPVSAVLTRLASRGGTVAPETREAITAMLGQGGGNIFQQYIDYLKNIFTGNWGVWNFSYFDLIKGITYDGVFYQGVDWLSWVLLFHIPVFCLPCSAICFKEYRKLKNAAK